MNVAPVRAPARELAESERAALVAAAVPALAAGASLREVAAAAGIGASTLQGWCLVYDGEGYRAALASQVAAHLTGAAEELAECARMARVGSSMTVKGRRIVTSDGDKSTGYALHGPAIVAAARARASIALDAGKFWQWLAERRLPALFGERDKTAPARPAASFTFILNGQRSTTRGRLVASVPAALPSRGAVELEPEGT